MAVVHVKSARIARLFLLGLLFCVLFTLLQHQKPSQSVRMRREGQGRQLLTREANFTVTVNSTSSQTQEPVHIDVLVENPPMVKAHTDVLKETKSENKDGSYTRYCYAMMEGGRNAYTEAKLLMKFHPEHQIPTDTVLTRQVKDCPAFTRERGYATSDDVTQEDREFPIAYSIVFHKDVGLVERLLKSIYQPQNFYCLHVDKRSSREVHDATEALVTCFPNVFIASDLEEVVYASFTRLKADINCMKDLATKDKKWKYLINLTGQVFPLKTNSEIVKILTIYNGANDIEGTNRGVLNGVAHRYNVKWKVSKRGQGFALQKMKTQVHPPPPHNISLVKGSAFGVFSRAFVEFTLTDQMARDLLEWSRDTYSPDEVYWSTLNHRWVNPMLKAPGGYDNAVPDRKPWLAMYSSWRTSVPKGPCAGKYVHDICIFSLRDLPNLISRQELFANKFYRDTEPMTLDCLEEWLRLKATSNLPFDGQYYRDLPFVLS